MKNFIAIALCLAFAVNAFAHVPENKVVGNLILTCMPTDYPEGMPAPTREIYQTGVPRKTQNPDEIEIDVFVTDPLGSLVATKMYLGTKESRVAIAYDAPGTGYYSIELGEGNAGTFTHVNGAGKKQSMPYMCSNN